MIYQWHFPFCPNKYGTRKNTMTITETTTTISRKMRWNGNFDYCKIKWRRRKLPTKYIYRPRQIIWFNGQILVNANTFTFSWNNIPIFFLPQWMMLSDRWCYGDGSFVIVDGAMRVRKKVCCLVLINSRMTRKM